MSGRNVKLQELRVEKCWTLRVAAKHMAVSRTVLFNAEQGVMPRVDHAIQIAAAYRMSVEDLWKPGQDAESCSGGRPVGRKQLA
jgi:DNA-binding XRE family transcriptional regulator